MDGGAKSNPLYESDDEGDPRIDALYDLMDADGDGKNNTCKLPRAVKKKS